MGSSNSPNRMGRRELLAYLAGLPASMMVGCGSRGAIGFDGNLLSPDFSIGHRLRDGWRPAEPVAEATRHRVIVVGAGIAGLSAAWKLLKEGIEDVVVLELGESPGGTSISGRRSGFDFPWGAHYVPVPMKENVPLIDLLRQMQVVTGTDEGGEPVVAEQYLCREPEERVFHQGIWQSGLYPAIGATEEELAEVLRFRRLMQDWATRRDQDGKRLFTIPMSVGSSGEEVRELDQLSMSQWMASQDFHSERLNWLVDYACRDDYGLSSGQTSAWAGVFYFASRLRDQESESQPVITWPEGNGRIVNFLSDSLGDRVRVRHAVTGIRRSDQGVMKVRAFDTQANASREFVGDDVIFALPQFLAPHLISGWDLEGRSVKTFRYGGWVVANIFLRDRPAETHGAMSWDNVIYDSRSLGYVTSTHQTGADHGPTVITWYHPMLDHDPRVSRAELLKLTWEDWANVVVADLRKAHPDIESLIERIDVMRWGHAMIQPRVGFVWGGEREGASKSIGRLHFAGTDLSGVALMEEAFDRGIRAASKCLA